MLQVLNQAPEGDMEPQAKGAIPATLFRWVGEIVLSIPSAARGTVGELILGSVLAGGGHVTGAFLALTPRWGWRFFQLSRQPERHNRESALRSRGLQDGEHSGGATKMKQATTVGGNVLVVASAETEKGAELVIPSTEPIGGIEFLETPHISDPAFERA
jgi:hypothetical protein